MKIKKKRNLPAENSLPRGKVLLFKTVGLIIPLIILLLSELTLRIFHYGNNLDLFVELAENKNYLVLNPNASQKYFTKQEFATTSVSEPFRKKKEPGSVRIFVLGESTTVGYPYFFNGSFHRWLQYRLMFTCPDKKFEIVNISLTAVNSYTVLGFAKEVMNYEPDAILIYTGHNEYYGSLGVASTDKIGGNSFVINLVLKLRELRLIQLMTNVYQKIAGSFKNASGGTRMKMMVADSHIPYNSDLYYKGIDQFRSNMDKILNLFNKNHIPVFISNLVCNEKDLKPFVSITNDSSRYSGFEENFKHGEKEFENNNLELAFQYFNKADQIYNGHALCNFYMGKLALKSADSIQAKKYFDRARELDGLRFRAPQQLNEIISQLCDKYPDAYLVDSKGDFEAWSAGHIIGNELLLDHVHPNLTGYAFMSDVFYEAMKKEKLITPGNEGDMTFKQLLKQMPVTKVDSLVGLYRISFLKNSWPFSEVMQKDSIKVSSEEEKLAWSLATNKTSWKESTRSLFTYCINNNRQFEAMKAAEALALEYRLDNLVLEKAAMISSNLNDNKNAVMYFNKAFDLSPSFDYAKYIFAIYLKMDKPAEAIPFLDYAIQNNPTGMNLPLIKTYVREIIQLKNTIVKGPADTDVLNKIAYIYLKMGNTDGASLYVNKVLTVDSRNSDALTMLRQIKIKGQ